MDAAMNVTVSPAPPTLQYRLVRMALILSTVMVLVAFTILCFCPWVFVLMGGFAAAGIAFGTRSQRLYGVTLLAAAIILGVGGYRQEKAMMERHRQLMEKLEKAAH
jgi:hypothetical protein